MFVNVEFEGQNLQTCFFFHGVFIDVRSLRVYVSGVPPCKYTLFEYLQSKHIMHEGQARMKNNTPRDLLNHDNTTRGSIPN